MDGPLSKALYEAAFLTGHANWKKARSQSITWSFVGFGIAVGLFLATCLFAEHRGDEPG